MQESWKSAGTNVLRWPMCLESAKKAHNACIWTDPNDTASTNFVGGPVGERDTACSSSCRTAVGHLKAMVHCCWSVAKPGMGKCAHDSPNIYQHSNEGGGRNPSGECNRRGNALNYGGTLQCKHMDVPVGHVGNAWEGCFAEAPIRQHNLRLGRQHVCGTRAWVGRGGCG